MFGHAARVAEGVHTFSIHAVSTPDTTKMWTMKIPARMAVNRAMLPKKTSPPMSLNDVAANTHPGDSPCSPSSPSDTASSPDLARKLLPMLAGGQRFTHLPPRTTNQEIMAGGGYGEKFLVGRKCSSARQS